MRESTGLRVTVLAVALATLAGCAAVDTAQNVYTAAKTGYTAKAAYNDVKDIKTAEPAFSGYSSVLVYSELVPRDQEKATAMKSAFSESMVYQVQQLGSAVGAQLVVCQAASACGGRVLSVQFREEAYNANLGERLLMGSQLKGKLVYVDNASGRVIAEKRIEGVDTYADVLGLIRGSMMMSMLRSYNGAGATEETMNRVKAVKPGYEKLLSAS